MPEHPFSLADGGWGAWEIAGRVSTIDLNDQLGTATGIAGGRQTIYTAGLNWYVNRNVRFMFDYLHGNVARQVSPTNTTDAGSRFDAFAMRTQVTRSDRICGGAGAAPAVAFSVTGRRHTLPRLLRTTD